MGDISKTLENFTTIIFVFGPNEDDINKKVILEKKLQSTLGDATEDVFTGKHECNN